MKMLKQTEKEMNKAMSDAWDGGLFSTKKSRAKAKARKGAADAAKRLGKPLAKKGK